MLRIALISVNGEPLAKPLVADFGEAGGGIGRDERNKLALPDPERRLSRVQALVRFERNYFSLIDQGAVPTIVNGIPLAKGSSLRLHDGDLIDAAGFRMRVELSSAVLTKSQGSENQGHHHIKSMSADVEGSTPWGYEAPALGVLSEPAENQAKKVLDKEMFLTDPFDELLAEEVCQPACAPADSSWEGRFAAVLDAFSPEQLERRLRSVTDSISGDADRAQLWNAYQAQFPEIAAEAVWALRKLLASEQKESELLVDINRPKQEPHTDGREL